MAFLMIYTKSYFQYNIWGNTLVCIFFTRVELNSDVFYSQLQPFLFNQTEHFIHEFISFARSPFDVTAYDERALYNWDNESREQVRETPTVFHSQTSG